MRNWFTRKIARRIQLSRLAHNGDRSAIRRLVSESLEKRLLLATVTAENPAAAAVGVAVTTNVSATYDEVINATSATAANFIVHSERTGGVTAANGTVSADGMTITVDPNTDFAPGAVVQVTSTGNIQGTSAGVKRVWQFRTASSGSGIFEASSQDLGSLATGEVAFGDLDGDGDQDAIEGGNGRIMLNDGSGVFTESGQAVTGVGQPQLGDVDGDGDLDIVGSSVWKNNGSGVFSEDSTGNGNILAIGDLDGDGDLDAMTGVAYASNRVLFNNGNGGFTDSGQSTLGNSATSAIEFADFDGDGDLDAWAAVIGGTGNDLFLNDGNGVFSHQGGFGGFQNTTDVDVGDVDGDGDIDVFVSQNTRGLSGNRLWLNDGNAVFTNQGVDIGAREFAYSTEMGDLDGDGDLDIVVNNLVGGGGPSRIFLNDGAGNFSDSGQGLNNIRSYGVDIGDVDGDGDLDIWFAGNSQPSQLWFNVNLNPNVSLSIDNAAIAEDAGSATVTATLDAAFGQDVTINLGLSGSATETDDYTISANQIVIAAGDTTGSVTVTAVQDALDEPDETVIVDMTSIINGQGSGQVTTTITDDDAEPTVTLATDVSSISEAAGVATLTATLSAASGQQVTVDLGISGTATDADDYTLSSGQIVIPAGSTSGTTTVTAVDDAIDEPDETVIADIASVTGATEDGEQQATVTITDDDLPPTVSLAVDSPSIAENGGQAVFTATLSAPSLTATTIDLAVSGTATGGTDYTISGTQITIAAGDTSGSVTVTSLADVNITEGPETIIVDIDAVTGNASEDGTQQVTATIIDDVNGPDVSIAVDNTSIPEAGGVATITATLANAFSLDVTIDFALTGTATSGTDYTADTQIVVAAGATTGTATITGVDDGLIEGDETIVVDVSAVTNGNEDGEQQVTVTLTDDESPPTVTLSVDNSSIAEAAGAATVTATLSAATTLNVTVDLGISGTASAADYSLSGSQIVIAAGATSGTVTITAVDDTVDDDDETVVVDISAVSNATESGDQQVTVTILDDDDAPPLPPGPTPPNASHDALTSTVVGYTFAGPIPDGAANDQTFTVHSLADGQLTGGDTVVTQSGATALHSPTNNFRAGELVHATVTSALGTKAVWNFRTAVGGGLGTFTFGGQNLNNSPDENIATYGSGVADFDGDGDLDIFFANGNSGATNQDRVWLNDGTGIFTDSGQRLANDNSRDIAVGDVDGDGDVDAIVVNDGGQANRVWINDGNGVFSDTTFGGNNSERVAIGDVDGDGDLDVVVANNNTGNGVYANDGNGTFSQMGTFENRGSWGIDLGDLDGDGDLDALVANGNTDLVANSIFFNNGNGSFTDSGQVLAPSFSTQAVLGDLDGDGDLDGMILNFDGFDTVLINDGTGVMTDSGQQIDPVQSYSRTTDAQFADLDADGDLDLVTTSQLTRPTLIWQNDGDGNFSEIGSLNHPDGGTNNNAVTLADINNDGDLDIITSVGNTFNQTRRVSLLWTNDNPTNAVSITVDNASIAEDGVATITATASAASAQDITVSLAFSGTATEGTDYNASGSQIVIAAGSTTGSITVTAVQDAVDEADETVVVDVSGVQNGVETGTQQVTITIVDDDEPVVPTVTLGVDNLSIAEDGGIATFTATLSEATSVDVTVDLAVSGTASAADYTISGTQIVIGAGATSGSITVTGVDDAENESSETVIIDIDSVTNGNEDGVQQATTTIADDDVPPSLRVDSLTATSTGFIALFNNDLTPDVLNLYDNSTAGAGPADVVLSGASSGTIAGSLVIGARSVEFIQTDEALAADTYTVTLRSAADGFSAGTDLLDGDGDGTGGDDYSSSFTVAEPAAGAVTVSVPDIVRGPGQPVNVPANGTGLPLTVSEGAGVRNVTLSVDYDPALLSITAAEVGAGLPAGAAVTLDTSNAGTAVVTFTSPADLPAGEVAFVTLTADVPTANAADNYGAKQVLNIHSLSITDGSANAVPSIENDGLHLSEYFADVSGNRRVNAADAAQVARVAALIDNGFGQSLSTDPIIIGDVSGNGRINAADASLVAQVAALIPVDQVPDIPSGVFSSAGGNAGVTVIDATLQLPVDFGQEANSADTAATAVDHSISEMGFAENIDGNAKVNVAADKRDLETLFGDEADNELLDDVADQLALSLLGRSE